MGDGENQQGGPSPEGGPHVDSPSDLPASRRTVFVAALLFAGTLYTLTCAPGVLWQDSALFQYRTHVCDLTGGPLGLALSHPLYILLVQPLTWLSLGNQAYCVNLFSALCATLAVAFFIDLMFALTRSLFAATCASILLAVSHTFWRHAVAAEVISLYGLGLVVELWCLERFFSRRQIQWLLAALLVNGLGISNHLLAALHLPVYVGVMVWARRQGLIRAGHILAGVAAHLVGDSTYLLLIAHQLVHGRGFAETIKSALFGEVFAKDVLNTHFSILRQSLRTAQYFSLNFPTPLILAAPVGWIIARRSGIARWFAWAAGAIFAVNFLFAFRYPVPDQYVFFIAGYILWPAFAAFAIASLPRKSTVLRALVILMALAPAAVYEAAPSLLRRYSVAVPFRQDVPFRDAYAYYLRPRLNNETSARRFATAALSRAAPDGLLIADFTVNSALIYVRDVKGIERNVTLTLPADYPPKPPAVETRPEAVEPFVARNAAYITTNSPKYVPAWILDRYDLIPTGAIYRLQPKHAAK